MNHSNHNHHDNLDMISIDVMQVALSCLFLLALFAYFFAVKTSNRRHKQWPFSRTIFWILGICSIGVATLSPLQIMSHSNFVAHMIIHFLIGMLAPLFIVCSAPMTLLLRTVHVKQARLLTRLLKSRLNQMLLNPIVTLLLNIGGLWLLYMSPLFSMMSQDHFLHWFIHVHLFIAGYLFTLSIIYIEPIPHKNSFVFRSVVLLIALAGHGILSKYLYAYPPNGVPKLQAEIGGYFMFYAGDMVDVILIYMICYQWFRASRPRATSTMKLDNV